MGVFTGGVRTSTELQRRWPRWQQRVLRCLVVRVVVEKLMRLSTSILVWRLDQVLPEQDFASRPPPFCSMVAGKEVWDAIDKDGYSTLSAIMS